MRRKNAREVVVNNPGKGLLKNIPPDLQNNNAKEYLTEAQNIRAEDGSIKAAPGYERVAVVPKNLDSPANLIHQANITSVDEEARKVPIIGTETSLYSVDKRSSSYQCQVGGSSPYGPCSLVFAATSDSGKVGNDIANVSKLIRKWEPEIVLHAGDLVYANGGSGTPGVSNYEEQVAQYYSWAMGPYGGLYTGGDENYFFPVLGNHDWDDGPGSKYLGFFDLPGNEQYYDLKRGPIHFFFLDSYGNGPTSTGPGETSIEGTGAGSGIGQSDLSDTGPMATWLKLTMATSDCPIRIVVMHHPPYSSESTYYPGYSVLRWPFREWGADLLICGHSHCYERIIMPDGCTMVTIGTGGHSLRGFNATPVEGSQVRYSSKFGALYGLAEDNVFTCQFIDVDGNVQDTFSKGVSREVGLCYKGDVSRQGRKLVVVPDTKRMEIDLYFPFRAYVEYTNGFRENVTLKAAWGTSDSNVAGIDNTGEVKTKNVGDCEVIANYAGLTGVADLEVRARCLDAPIEVVVVMDNSGSMMNTASPTSGETRLDRAKEGLKLFLDAASVTEYDKVGLISFAGLYKEQIARVWTLSPLTNDTASLYSEVDHIGANGDTGIADALKAAHDMLKADHIEGYRKVIVLFTDGIANVVSTDLDPDRVLPTYDGAGKITNASDVTNQAVDATSTQATAIKADDITLIVIGFDLKTYAGAYATVQGWASTGFYYDAESGDELVNTFSELFTDLCEEQEETSGDIGSGGGNV